MEDEFYFEEEVLGSGEAQAVVGLEKIISGDRFKVVDKRVTHFKLGTIFEVVEVLEEGNWYKCLVDGKLSESRIHITFLNESVFLR